MNSILIVYAIFITFFCGFLYGRDKKMCDIGEDLKKIRKPGEKPKSKIIKYNPTPEGEIHIDGF